MLIGTVGILAGLLGVAAERPNVILFMVDDLGWQDLSVPMSGEMTAFNKRYRTPNLEKLAEKSMVYEWAWAAAPVCTPSRTAVMTGKSPARTGITYWTLGGDTSAKDERVDPPRWQWEGLKENDGPFLPELMREAGYRTIHVGKAHFGQIGKFAADPKAIGFDVNIAGHAAGGPGSFYGTQNFAASLRQGKEFEKSVWDVPGLENYHGEDIYLTEALTLEGVAAVRDAVEDGEKFFLHFAPYAVHAPIMANEKYLAKYTGLDQREAAYATMIETYDAALGALISELERAGVEDKTVIVFTSDNGGLSAHSREGKDDRNAPLRAGKGSFYEGGTRVPLIIFESGKRGGRSDARVVGTDLFAEILGMAGVDRRAVDGVRIGKRGDKAIVWHQPHFWGVKGQGIEPFSSVVEGTWKLVYRHRDGGVELYDLAKDVGETNDLAVVERGVVSRLRRVLGTELRRRGAQMGTWRDNGKVVPWPDAG